MQSHLCLVKWPNEGARQIFVKRNQEVVVCCIHSSVSKRLILKGVILGDKRLVLMVMAGA